MCIGPVWSHQPVPMDPSNYLFILCSCFLVDSFCSYFFSPTSPSERHSQLFISPECRDDEEEAQCSPARWFASSLEEQGRLHGAMCSAVYTIPKGLKRINQHCASFLFLMTYYHTEKNRKKINIAEKKKNYIKNYSEINRRKNSCD